jgi:hypothetical protein
VCKTEIITTRPLNHRKIEFFANVLHGGGVIIDYSQRMALRASCQFMSSFFASWLPTTICAFLIPFALRLLPMFRNPSSSGPHPRPPPAPTPLRTPISTLLALYILYTLYTLIFARPPNLFTALRLSLNAPQSTIHSALLLQHLQQLPPDHRQALSAAAAAAAANGSTAVPVLPPALEKLLARLASSDARMILVRCVPFPRSCILVLDLYLLNPSNEPPVTANAPSRPVLTA